MTSDGDVRSIARFIIGFGTEEDHVWRDYNLDFAGTIHYNEDGSPGSFHPVGLSGYSLGSLQWDFGQQPELAPPFVEAFEDWIQKHPGKPDLVSDPEFVRRALSLNGAKLSAMPGMGLWRQDVTALSQYARTDDGSEWVNQHIDNNLIGSDANKKVVIEMKQFGPTLVAVAREVEKTVAFKEFQRLKKIDVMRLVHAIGMKAYNQSPGSYRKKWLTFLATIRTDQDVKEWYKSLGGGLRSGVEAATDLSTFWASWKTANPGKWLDDLEKSMSANPTVNPVAFSKTSGEYVLSKQVFEDVGVFEAFMKAVHGNSDYVPAGIFNKNTGAITVDARTNRMHCGVLRFKGMQYVWDAAGNAFKYDGVSWNAFAVEKINIKTL